MRRDRRVCAAQRRVASTTEKVTEQLRRCGIAAEADRLARAAGDVA